VNAAFERAKLSPPHSPALVVLRWLLTFALIFASGALGFALPRLGSRLPLLILPSGFAVAAMYRWGWRMWPAVFTAGVAIDLSTHQPLVASIGVGIGLAAGAALSARVLEWRGFDASFSRAKDVPLFILAAAVGMALAPAFGFLGFYLAGVTAEASRPINWIRWWSNSTAGVLLVAPCLVAFSRRGLAQFTEHWAEGAMWLFGVAIFCGAIMLAPSGPNIRPPIALLAVLLIVIGAIRFGLLVAASASFAISMLTAYSVAFDRGVFSNISELHGLITIWTLSAVLTGLTLIITALLAERDAAALDRLRAEQRYAQIFNDSPQPIWVHDPVSRKFLMINEAAVRQYGWRREEMLAMSVEALLPPGASFGPMNDDGEAARSSAAEPFETRHLTRDGRVLEVEVWTRPTNFGGQRAELVFAFDVTERRAFGSALIEAVAHEQRRIGQEMHDGLGQELTGLALSARALANRAERERDAIAGDLGELASLASSCIQDARLIVQGLSPLTDAEGSLEAALETLARRSSLSGTGVRFRARHEAPLTVELKVRNHLYRIAQEAVQNALKHSGAHCIDIELCTRERSVLLEIIDDGRGVPTERMRDPGLGMRTLRFRASAIGGRLTITRRPGGGNSVVCEAPQTRERARPAAEGAAS
jgi:PAS domain S-box-containing protein